MNTKSIAKVLGTVLGASTLVAAFAAHADVGQTLINPNDGIPFGSWGPIQTSINNNPFAPITVRGQLSKRHSRERLFYNTTTATGGYDRLIRIRCLGEVIQPDNVGPFTNTTDGDLTMFCLSGGSLVLPSVNMVREQWPTTNASFAVITAHPF